MKLNKQHTVQIDFGGKLGKKSVSTTHNVQALTFDKKTKMLTAVYDVNKNGKNLKAITYSDSVSKTARRSFNRVAQMGKGLGEAINRILGNRTKNVWSGMKIIGKSWSAGSKNPGFAKTMAKVNNKIMGMTQYNTWNPLQNETQLFGVEPINPKSKLGDNAHNRTKKALSGGK